MMQLIPNPNIPIKIIFEDESIIVIDKPAGMPCYPLKAGEKDTIANGLAARSAEDTPKKKLLTKTCHSCESRNPVQFNALDPRFHGDDRHIEHFRGSYEAGIVHRLDNNTSGLLLAAKNQRAIDTLRAQFDGNKILKRYTALVLGETPQKGVIETPIIHDPKDKKKMKISPLTPRHYTVGGRAALSHKGRGGLSAHTTYKLLKKYAGGQYSLLEVTIKTGVRHQIRVHLASIGHPIAGDKLYLNTRQRMRDKTGLLRQFLHASLLGFNHPSSGKRVEFSSPLPEELRNVLTNLKEI
ncbi:MAG: hypothetical protein HYT75_05900 [Deltaproteobacteria bacterium]|nr:hypothetical protein [Deltaproteobacteria bacterium]